MSAPTVAQGGRRRRSAGSSAAGPNDRLPAPTRERRPALAALAVLLIVGGALMSALIVLRSGNRSDYLVITHEIAVGQKLQSSDFGTASLAGSGVNPISALARNNFVGSYATTRMYAGELATAQLFSVKPLAAPGSSLVGVQLGDGSRPSVALKAGNVVGLYFVPTGNQAGGATTATQVLKAARVVDVASTANGLGGSSGQYVTLLIPDAKAPDVTFDAVSKQLAVVLLPDGTTPDIDFAAPVPVPTTSTTAGAVQPPATTSAAAK